MKNFNLLIVHFNLLRSSLKGKGAENRRITHLSATLQNYPLRGKILRAFLILSVTDQDALHCFKWHVGKSSNITIIIIVMETLFVFLNIQL